MEHFLNRKPLFTPPTKKYIPKFHIDGKEYTVDKIDPNTGIYTLALVRSSGDLEWYCGACDVVVFGGLGAMLSVPLCSNPKYFISAFFDGLSGKGKDR
jgi:hypothetical protein